MGAGRRHAPLLTRSEAGPGVAGPGPPPQPRTPARVPRSTERLARAAGAAALDPARRPAAARTPAPHASRTPPLPRARWGRDEAKGGRSVAPPRSREQPCRPWASTRRSRGRGEASGAARPLCGAAAVGRRRPWAGRAGMPRANPCGDGRRGSGRGVPGRGEEGMLRQGGRAAQVRQAASLGSGPWPGGGGGPSSPLLPPTAAAPPSSDPHTHPH